MVFSIGAAVDDGAGMVADALFCEMESTRGHFSFSVAWYGAGYTDALYADRHAVFKYTPPSEIVGAPTQFSRAMDELGIQLTYAQPAPWPEAG